MSSGFWLFLSKFHVIKTHWILISSCTFIYILQTIKVVKLLKRVDFLVGLLFGQCLKWIFKKSSLMFQRATSCCGFINLMSAQVHTTCSKSDYIEELPVIEKLAPKNNWILTWFSCLHIYRYKNLDYTDSNLPCVMYPEFCSVLHTPRRDSLDL